MTCLLEGVLRLESQTDPIGVVECFEKWVSEFSFVSDVILLNYQHFLVLSWQFVDEEAGWKVDGCLESSMKSPLTG